MVLLEELETSSTGSLTNNCLDFGAEREEIAVPGSANIPHHGDTICTSEEMKAAFLEYGR